MASTTKNIITVFNSQPYYMSKKISSAIMKNPIFKTTPNLFLQCQTTKCRVEFTNYMKHLTKKNFGTIITKSSSKEIKEITSKIRKSKEYKASSNCLIEKCYDKYISFMNQNDKIIPEKIQYCKNLISVYNETIKELESVKVDDKLVASLNKHKLKTLHNMSKKDIHSMYKSFITKYKEQVKGVEKMSKIYKKIEKRLPIYDKLQKEDKKEEYIFARTFEFFN